LWNQQLIGVSFETYEVDLENKSEEFLSVSPTGKVPVVVADGDSLYESNVVNQYLDEVFESPKLLPEDPKQRVYARIWMASADDNFFPAVFIASVGCERGVPSTCVELEHPWKCRSSILKRLLLWSAAFLNSR
jgi:glutathione S-transferase